MDSDDDLIFEMRLEPAGRQLTVVVAGELDVGTARPVLDLAASVAGQYDDVIVEASQLTFMSSSGLTALLALRRSVRRLRVRGPSRAVRRVIELTGLDDYLGLEGQS